MQLVLSRHNSEGGGGDIFFSLSFFFFASVFFPLFIIFRRKKRENKPFRSSPALFLLSFIHFSLFLPLFSFFFSSRRTQPSNHACYDRPDGLGSRRKSRAVHRKGEFFLVVTVKARARDERCFSLNAIEDKPPHLT